MMNLGKLALLINDRAVKLYLLMLLIRSASEVQELQIHYVNSNIHLETSNSVNK